jgi:hypothetical protein
MISNPRMTEAAWEDGCRLHANTADLTFFEQPRILTPVEALEPCGFWGAAVLSTCGPAFLSDLLCKFSLHFTSAFWPSFLYINWMVESVWSGLEWCFHTGIFERWSPKFWFCFFLCICAEANGSNQCMEHEAFAVWLELFCSLFSLLLASWYRK